MGASQLSSLSSLVCLLRLLTGGVLILGLGSQYAAVVLSPVQYSASLFSVSALPEAIMKMQKAIRVALKLTWIRNLSISIISTLVTNLALP